MSGRGIIHISQGEHAVCDNGETCIATILGSCVAACLWDSIAGVGGMNHILIPERMTTIGDFESHGVNAMEILINDIVKRGGDRFRLQAKLFGGATMNARLGDLGQRNAGFALEFLRAENIPCVASCLGGSRARRIEFWPASGRARQRFVKRCREELPHPQRAGAQRLDSEAGRGAGPGGVSDVELF